MKPTYLLDLTAKTVLIHHQFAVHLHVTDLQSHFVNTAMCRKAIRQALDSGEGQDMADSLDTLNLLGAASQVVQCTDAINDQAQ